MRSLLRLQGGYYVLGGLWPLVHFRSFEQVAGPKPDRFQTQVTSVLFISAGVTLLAGISKPGPAAPQVRLLATGAGTGLALLDLAYRRRLRGIFRVEALMETIFAVGAASQGRK